ncbi:MULTISPECIES: tetratricopeptide repeat protein [unclassified Sphingomonas]|uniref:tetratricopeptide repeat protein n=1 Tax=unclassified Sphingomonas TaxID=196159 RepID=UPI0008303B13|nr:MULTISPECIES: tetratricopeptide repeat protein [unclassified Sphingomonas]
MLLTMALAAAPLPQQAGERVDIPDVVIDAVHAGRQEEAIGLLTQSYRSCAATARGSARCFTQRTYLAKMLAESGDPQTGEALARESVAEASRAGSMQEHALAWSILGITLDEQGRLREAESAYRSSLNLAGQSGDARQLDDSRFNLARNLEAQDRFGAAEQLRRDAAAHATRAFGPASIQHGRALIDLAQNLHGQGRSGDAMDVAQRSLAIVDAARPVDDSALGSAHNVLAVILHERGQTAQAERHYRSALRIKEAITGSQSESVGSILGNLASLLADQGREEEALPLYIQSYRISERALGSDHQRVGDALGNLAFNLDRLGRHRDAEPLHRRSVAIAERWSGPASLSAAHRLLNLSMNLRFQRRTEEALPMVQRVVAIREKVLGERTLNTARAYADLAATLFALGRRAEVEDAIRRSVRGFRAVPATHPDRIRAQSNFADLIADSAGGSFAYAMARDATEGALARIQSYAGSDPGQQRELVAFSRVFEARVGVAWKLSKR